MPILVATLQSDMVDDDRYTEYEHTEYEDETHPREVEERTYVAEEDEDDGGWWDEGMIALLLVTGTILFLFLEPGTSAIGILLIAAGVGGWVVDALN